MHREVDHKDELSCKKCNRNFVNLRSLEIHNRALHKGNLSEVTCVKCGEFFECLWRFDIVDIRSFVWVLIPGISVEKEFLKYHQKSCCVGNGETDQDCIKTVDSNANATPG